MNNLWIQETLDLVHELEKERDNLFSKCEELKKKMSEIEVQTETIEEKINNAYALIQTYKDKHNIQISHNLLSESSNFANKSYRELIIEVAQKNGGYLKVNNTVEFLYQINFSNDKRAIQANIYSVLNRNKNSFKKIKPGEYRLLTNIHKESENEPSGIRKSIKELKEKNPQMTKNEVLNYLIKNRFDFKGKRPAKAVNITWAFLGYSKEGKQQLLPGVN